MYVDVPMSFFLHFIDKRRNRELYSDSPNVNLMASVQNDCLGVTADGSWAEPPAHSRITLTPAGDVRLVSREQSPVPVEPPPEEEQPLRLLPRPETVTLEERAFLSDLAVSEAQEERN